MPPALRTATYEMATREEHQQQQQQQQLQQQQQQQQQHALHDPKTLKIMWQEMDAKLSKCKTQV
jgi:hypothetical protein